MPTVLCAVSEVRSRSGRESTNWAVFALANTSNEQIDKLIVAPHYRLVSSKVLWPDLDAKRIVAITPSEGFSLERLEDNEADVFLITLDPGSVITFIAEQNTTKLPKLYLWDPDSYRDTVNSFTLYRGIVTWNFRSIGSVSNHIVCRQRLFTLSGNRPHLHGLYWLMFALILAFSRKYWISKSPRFQFGARVLKCFYRLAC